MKNLQQVYIKYLQDVSDVLHSVKLDSVKQQELLKSIEQTELIVPVVGGFSAGKSTLINSFLGEDILSTAITPETALATELRYSEESYFEAVRDDGTIDKFNINQTEDIKVNSRNYQFLRLYLNNSNLKAIAPLVLVDMPGFDSPIELHNKAILSYLSRGKYFVVLISAEDGNITKSIFRELENIREFGKGFSFCISKANIKSPSDMDKIKAMIQDQLSDGFDYQGNVPTLGLDGGEELKNILQNIDAKSLFESIFINRLKENNIETQSSIDTIIATLKSTKENAQHAIDELKLGIDKLLAKKQSEISQIQSKYSDSSVNSIISSVANSVNMNVESLVSLAISNQQGFSSELNSIIKTTLVRAIKDKMADVGQNLVNSFSLEMKGLKLDGFKIDDAWIENIADATKDFLQKAQNGLNSFATGLDNKENAGQLYKTVATIVGLTTKVVNPLLEIIIVFLPDIISFFTNSMAESKKRDQAREQIVGNIIPSIKTKLREEMPSLINEQIEAMIETVSTKFDEQLKQKEVEIKTTMDEKNQEKEVAEARIKELDSAKEQIKSLATKAIYK